MDVNDSVISNEGLNNNEMMLLARYSAREKYDKSVLETKLFFISHTQDGVGN